MPVIDTTLESHKIEINVYTSVAAVGDASLLGNNIAIYMLTNRNNGKRYIGATKKGIAARLAIHYMKAGQGLMGKLPSAIRKYGLGAFNVEILEAATSWAECLQKEREWIAKLQPEYNMTAGGEGVLGLKFSNESRRKMSDIKLGRPAAWIGRWDAELIGRKISAKLKGRTYISSEAQKAAGKIKMIKMHTVSRKKVLCVTTGEVFDSVTNAAVRFGKTTGQISVWAKGKFKSKTGLVFRYVEKA